MDQEVQETTSSKARALKVLAAGSVGNFVEYYDFAIYGYTAGVLATLFFPEGDRTAALLATFALLGVAFLMRPLGGAFFGNLGDKIGRRRVLSTVILMMGASTFAVGLLPTYQQVGLLAPILLTACRLVQGFSAGAESSGAASFVVEYAPASRRGLWIGIVAAATVIPSVVAALTVLYLSTTVPEAAYNAWGWRLPFLIGGVLALVGLYVRLRMEETPAFQRIAESDEVADAPAIELIKNYKKEIGLIFALSSLNGLAFYVIAVYFVSHMTETLGLNSTAALLSTSVALTLLTIMIPLFGFVGDRVGRKPMLYAGSVWLIVASIPAFLLVGLGSLAAAFSAHLLLTIGLGFFAASQAVTLVEMFPTRVRYSGAAISFGLAYMVFGGTAPFAGTFLVSRTGSNISPAIYMVVVAATVLCVIFFAMPETYRRPILQGEEARTSAPTPRR